MLDYFDLPFIWLFSIFYGLYRWILSTKLSFLYITQVLYD